MFAELPGAHFMRKLKLRFESASDCQKRFDDCFGHLPNIEDPNTTISINAEVVHDGDYIFVGSSLDSWKLYTDPAWFVAEAIGFYRPNLRPDQIELLEKLHRL